MPSTGSTIPGSMTGTTNTTNDTVTPTGRGTPNGYASLDATAQVPLSQLGHTPGSSGPALTQIAVQTGNYTASANQAVPCDTTSGSFTVTLPSAPAGKSLAAVKQVIQGAGNAVTIACAGGDVFNKAGGVTTMTLTLPGQGALLLYGAGIWVVVADDLPLTQLDLRYDAAGAAAYTQRVFAV